MSRRTRITAIVFGTFVFLGISLLLTKAFVGSGNERAAVLDVLRAQAANDPAGMLEKMPACARDRTCTRLVEERAERLARPGQVQILTYTPSVQVALTNREASRASPGAPTERRFPVVQCVVVKRQGPLTGGGVELVSVSNPIGLEAVAAKPRIPLLLAAKDVLTQPCTVSPASSPSPPSSPDRSPPLPLAGADVPTRQTLYKDGPDGRYLLGGDWLFRLDTEDDGIKERFMRSTSTERLERGRPSRTPGTSATTRRSRWRARSAGTARTSRCPRRRRRWTGSSASSRSTTARGPGSTAARSARARAPTSRSSSTCATSSGAAPTGSSCASTAGA